MTDRETLETLALEAIAQRDDMDTYLARDVITETPDTDLINVIEGAL